MDIAWPSAPGTVGSVNVGRRRVIRWRGRDVETGIFKASVDRPVAVGNQLDGDDVVDRRYHGAPDRAVYAYAGEDVDWWCGQLGRGVEPGAFGENLTTRGIDVTNAVIGERWEVGTALLQVSAPRTPCFKLGIRFDDHAVVRRFASALRPGAYLRVLRPGILTAGDCLAVVHRPAHGLTIRAAAEAYAGGGRAAPHLLIAPELATSWREWATGRAGRDV